MTLLDDCCDPGRSGRATATSDRPYSCPVDGMRLPSATGPATSLSPRGGSWRQPVSAMLMAAVVYVPWLAATLFPLE
jgi:hypothetical protein